MFKKSPVGFVDMNGSGRRESYQKSPKVVMVVPKVLASGPKGPSGTLSIPEQSLKGISSRVAHSAIHPGPTGR